MLLLRFVHKGFFNNKITEIKNSYCIFVGLGTRGTLGLPFPIFGLLKIMEF